MSANPMVYVSKRGLSNMSPYDIAALLRYELMPWSDLELKYDLSPDTLVVTPDVAHSVAYDILDSLGSSPAEYREFLAELSADPDRVAKMDDSDLLFSVYREIEKARFWLRLYGDLASFDALLVCSDLSEDSPVWKRYNLDEYVCLYDYVESHLPRDV